jgi:hypothetical protein
MCGSTDVDKAMMAPRIKKSDATGNSQEKYAANDFDTPFGKLEDVGSNLLREVEAIAEGKTAYRPLRGTLYSKKDFEKVVDLGFALFPAPKHDA